MKVFWNCIDRNIERHFDHIQKIGAILNQTKGHIHKALIEKQKNSNVPHLVFVYDEYEDKTQAVSNILSKIKPDLQAKESFDPTQFVPPSKLISDSFAQIKPKYFKKKLVPYDEHEAMRQRFEFDQKQTKANATEGHEFLYPNDMRLNAADLDYKSMMNRVMFYLSRSRAEILKSKTKFKIPTNWVPPEDFNQRSSAAAADAFSSNVPKATLIPETEERLQLMKSFLIQHRRKKLRMSRELSRNQLEKEEFVAASLEEASSRWNSRYQTLNEPYVEQDFDRFEPDDDHDYSDNQKE